MKNYEKIYKTVTMGKRFGVSANKVLKVLAEEIPDDNERTDSIVNFLDVQSIINTISVDGYYMMDEFSLISDIDYELLLEKIDSVFPECSLLESWNIDGTINDIICRDCEIYYEKFFVSVGNLLDYKINSKISDVNFKMGTDFSRAEVERFWQIAHIDSLLRSGVNIVDTFTMSNEELAIVNAFQIIYGNSIVATTDGLIKAVDVLEYIYSDFYDFIDEAFSKHRPFENWRESMIENYSTFDEFFEEYYDVFVDDWGLGNVATYEYF